MKLRTDADFIATRLVNGLLYDVPDKKAFVQLLAQLDPHITAEIQKMPGISPSLQLYNCVKIKFLRKAMLARNLGIKPTEYDVILNHPRFLKKA